MKEWKTLKNLTYGQLKQLVTSQNLSPLVKDSGYSNKSSGNDHNDNGSLGNGFGTLESSELLMKMLDTIMEEDNLYKKKKVIVDEKNLSPIHLLANHDPSLSESPLENAKAFDKSDAVINKQLITEIILRKIKIQKIRLKSDFSNLKEIKEKVRSMASDLIPKFKNLTMQFSSNLDIKAQCTEIVKGMIESAKTTNMDLANFGSEKDQQQLKISFFEKMRKLEKEIKFCDKKIDEKKESVDVLQQKLIYITKGLHLKDLEDKKKNIMLELEELPKRKGKLILHGHSSSSKEVRYLTRLVEVYF